MKLHTIDTGFFKLDGGAMFGVVPKTLWNRLNPADNNNMCTWAMRCLLVEDGNKLTLIDTGIGNKQSEKFFGFYDLHGDDNLVGSIGKAGFSPEDITDVLLTHLHFDHVGGAVKWNKDHTGYETTFPNATYWSTEDHWQHALQPNPREKASFLHENLLPIEASGQLKFIGDDGKLDHRIDVLFSYGHTEKMMLPRIQTNNGTLVYMADLVPSAYHVPVNYVMGYDIRPLNAMNEKELFYQEALEKEYVLYFEHDPVNACATLQQTEKGVRVGNLGKTLEDLGL